MRRNKCADISDQPLLRILVLLMVLAPTSMVWAPALEVQRMKSSMLSFRNLYTSKRRSRKSLLLRIGCPAWIHVSRKHLEILRLDLQRWNRISAPSLHVCANLRHMHPQHEMYPLRHDPGLQLNKLTAPKPQGPMAQDHLMTTETQDAGLILTLVPKMNRHEVPSYYGSHANKTTKGLRSGSIIFVKNPTCQPTTNLSEFIAKQVLCRPDSYLKHEPNVRTLWPNIKTMVSHTKLTAPSAAPQQLSRCVNPNQLKTGRSESNLRLCGGCWPNSSKFSSLMEMTKVHLSSQRSTPAHKSSASKIEESGSENLCSNLPPLEVDSCLPLLHLTCVFLVFPVRCCNGSSLKPARPMCDGRPFASPLFRRLASRGALFRGFPFRWVLHFVLSLTRSVIVHDATLSSREVLFVNVRAHAMHCRASSLLPCGFSGANPYWCRRFSQRRISPLLVSRRSRSRPPHAYK